MGKGKTQPTCSIDGIIGIKTENMGIGESTSKTGESTAEIWVRLYLAEKIKV